MPVVLPPIQQSDPKPSVIVVVSPTQPLEKQYEPTRSPGIDTQTIRDEPDHRTRHDAPPPDPVRQPPMVVPTPPPEQKEFTEPNKKSSVEPTKTIPNNSVWRIDPELFEPDKLAPGAGLPGYKKKGKIGRKRKDEELGIDDVEPVKEVILFRQQMGKYWQGVSKDMQRYYDFWYFTRPKQGEKDYARHKACWERKQRWINPTSSTS